MSSPGCCGTSVASVLIFLLFIFFVKISRYVSLCFIYFGFGNLNLTGLRIENRILFFPTKCVKALSAFMCACYVIY